MREVTRSAVEQASVEIMDALFEKMKSYQFGKVSTYGVDDDWSVVLVVTNGHMDAIVSSNGFDSPRLTRNEYVCKISVTGVAYVKHGPNRRRINLVAKVKYYTKIQDISRARGVTSTREVVLIERDGDLVSRGVAAVSPLVSKHIEDLRGLKFRMLAEKAL